MSYLSFENNIIEASGSLILKSKTGEIDCSNAIMKNVTIDGSERITVTSISASIEDISFNGSNLLDISSIQVNNDVSCASLYVSTIGFENHDISFNCSNLVDVSSIQVNNDVSCASLFVDTIGFENYDISFNGSNLLDISSIQVNNDVSCASLFVDTIGFANHDISFNGSNLLDISSIQVNNDVSCASLNVSTIGFENHDISFNGSNLLDVSSIQVNYDISCASLNVSTIGFENHDISFNGSNLVDISSIQVNNDVSCASLFVSTIGFENYDISFNGSNLVDISSIQVNNDVSCASLRVDTIGFADHGIFFNSSNLMDISYIQVNNDVSCASLNVSTIGFENYDISFNSSNLIDVSSIQVNNDVSCASLNVSTIGFENYDISFNGSNLVDISSIQVNNDVSCASLNVSTIGFENNNISFNGSNLLDVSSIQVNNDVSCASLHVNTIGFADHGIFFNGSNLMDVRYINTDDILASNYVRTSEIRTYNNKNLIIEPNGSYTKFMKDVIIDGSLSIQTGELTLIKTVDLDICDNIIGLNRGNISGNDRNTSGMLINYADTSNVFFGYHNGENAFVIADTSYNHNDVGRDIVVDKYVDLKVGNTTIYNDSSDAILEVRVKNDSIRPEEQFNSEIRVFGSMLGSSKIVWGEENRDTDDNKVVSQYGGCIYYNGYDENTKTEFKRITTDNDTHNSFDDYGDISENTVFEYSHDSNNVTFYGDISCAGIITCKKITTTENIALNQASFNEITVNKLFCNNDACFNDISVNTIQANSAIITENDPVFTVSTNDFTVNNPHISNIKIIGNNLNNNQKSGFKVGGANLFLGEQTDYGSGIRYFSQPFTYDNSPDGFNNYTFDSPGTTVFYRKPSALEYPVFYYNYDSDDVKFNGNIEISGNLTVKEISIDACFNLIGNDPVFTVSTNIFTENKDEPHISNIKIIGNNETYSFYSRNGIDRYNNVGGANLFLGEQTDYGSGIRYFSQPFTYNNNSPDGFNNYTFDNSGTTVFYRKKNDEQNKLKEYPVFYYNYDSDDVTFNGNINIKDGSRLITNSISSTTTDINFNSKNLKNVNFINDIARTYTYLNTFDLSTTSVSKNDNIFEIKTRDENSCDTSTIRIIGGKSNVSDSDNIIMGQACLFLGLRTAVKLDDPIQDYGGGIRFFSINRGTKEFIDPRLVNYNQTSVPGGYGGITSFYRTSQNVEIPVFYFTHNNNTVYFNGDINIKQGSRLITNSISSTTTDISFNDKNLTHIGNISCQGIDTISDEFTIRVNNSTNKDNALNIINTNQSDDYSNLNIKCASAYNNGRASIKLLGGKSGGISDFITHCQLYFGNAASGTPYIRFILDNSKKWFKIEKNINGVVDEKQDILSIKMDTDDINFNDHNLTSCGDITATSLTLSNVDVPTIELIGTNSGVAGANLFLGQNNKQWGGGIFYFSNTNGALIEYNDFDTYSKSIISEGMTAFYTKTISTNPDMDKKIAFYMKHGSKNVWFTADIYVDGICQTSNGVCNTSDYRLKTNIEELDENITVTNLRPLVYLKNGQKEIGLIAHELQEVYPFMVHGEKDGKEMQSVNYNNLIGVLINDVKRLTKENDTLKSDYNTLKSDYNTLKSRLDILEEKFIKKFE